MAGPGNLNLQLKACLRAQRDYLEEIQRLDISRVGGVRRDPDKAADADVYHYRDNTGLEVDTIVQRRNGDWCAFEVKLGVGQIDEAAATLLKFRNRLDLDKCGNPGTLGVIVSSGYGYRREDGIAVIPIGALGP